MTRSYLTPAALLLALSLGCGGTPTTGEPQPEPDAPAPPKAEVRGDANLNAPDADYARPQHFTFTVANTGGSPLELKLAHKSCSCSQVDLPAPIAPNSEGKVVIHWTPAVGSAGAFSLGADVRTNEPKGKPLHFAISARVRPLVRVLIEGREDNAYLDFGDEPISPDEKRTREVTVFSTALNSFTLNAACAEPGFKVKQTPLPPGASVGPDDTAQSGYTLEISTTRDLPPGFIRTQLNLTLSGLGDGQPDRTVTFPVYAVAGQGVCALQPAAFRFSKASVLEEDTAKVWLTYINAPAKEDVTVESVEPAFLQVDKPKKELNGKWLITARLPGNNAEAAKYQAEPPMVGKVVLKVAGLDRPVTVEVKWNPVPQPPPKPK